MVLFDLSKLEEENILLESEMQEPEFWNNQERAQKISQKLKHNSNRIDEYKYLKQQVEDIEVFVDMIREEDDDSHMAELRDNMSEVSKLLEDARIVALLSGEYDQNNAIFPFMLEQAVLKHRIGQICFIVCSQGGLKPMAIA